MEYQQKLKIIRKKQYSLIETGKRELHIDQLKKICEHFKISENYILEIKIKQ